MKPLLRLSRRLSWIFFVLLITACSQIRPAVIAPPAMAILPTIAPQPPATHSPPTLVVTAANSIPAQASTQAKSASLILAPLRPEITDYVAYRVQKGDTVEKISARAGSKPALLLAYNRLTSAPQPGRELLIPRLAGYKSEIKGTHIMVVRGNTQKRWVALTFDCGGINPNVPKLLDTLRDAGIKVTFFLHGDSIAQNPALLRRMLAEGHELGNHSYSHADFTKLTPRQMRAELDKTEAVIQSILGKKATTRPYVRLPYGAYNPTVIKTVVSHGYMPIHWSIDSLDSHSKRRTPAEIATMVDKQLTEQQVPGAIVLMHCMDRSIEAVPQILQKFKSRQIEVKTVTEVLGP